MLRLLGVALLTACGFHGPAATTGDGPAGTEPAPARDASPGAVDASPLDAVMIDAGHPKMCLTTYPIVSPADHHYKVLTNKSWMEGTTACNDMGHLVEIETSTENDFVATIPISSSYAWIGLKDIAGNDVYVWTNGDAMMFNGFGGTPPASSDDCVDAANGSWTPYACSFKEDAICECE